MYHTTYNTVNNMTESFQNEYRRFLNQNNLDPWPTNCPTNYRTNCRTDCPTDWSIHGSTHCGPNDWQNPSSDIIENYQNTPTILPAVDTQHQSLNWQDVVQKYIKPVSTVQDDDESSASLRDNASQSPEPEITSSKFLDSLVSPISKLTEMPEVSGKIFTTIFKPQDDSSEEIDETDKDLQESESDVKEPETVEDEKEQSESGESVESSDSNISEESNESEPEKTDKTISESENSESDHDESCEESSEESGEESSEETSEESSEETEKSSEESEESEESGEESEERGEESEESEESEMSTKKEESDESESGEMSTEKEESDESEESTEKEESDESEMSTEKEESDESEMSTEKEESDESEKEQSEMSTESGETEESEEGEETEESCEKHAEELEEVTPYKPDCFDKKFLDELTQIFTLCDEIESNTRQILSDPLYNDRPHNNPLYINAYEELNSENDGASEETTQIDEKENSDSEVSESSEGSEASESSESREGSEIDCGFMEEQIPALEPEQKAEQEVQQLQSEESQGSEEMEGLDESTGLEESNEANMNAIILKFIPEDPEIFDWMDKLLKIISKINTLDEDNLSRIAVAIGERPLYSSNTYEEPIEITYKEYESVEEIREESEELERHPEYIEIPQVPEMPEVLEMPEIPEVPEMPEVPEIPNIPNIPQMPRSYAEIAEVPRIYLNPYLDFQLKRSILGQKLADINRPDVPESAEECNERRLRMEKKIYDLYFSLNSNVHDILTCLLTNDLLVLSRKRAMLDQVCLISILDQHLIFSRDIST